MQHRIDHNLLSIAHKTRLSLEKMDTTIACIHLVQDMGIIGQL